MVSMPTSTAEKHGFESRSRPSKDYEIGIYCFSAKHTVLTTKSKEWLVQN
jgi:hypothetical protein